MPTTNYFARDEGPSCRVLGKILAGSIDVALSLARMKYGAGVYVSTSDRPPRNRFRYLNPESQEHGQCVPLEG